MSHRTEAWPCRDPGARERTWKALGEGAQTTGKTQECGSGAGKASSEGPREPARVGGREGQAEACLQHMQPRHSSAAHMLATGSERNPVMQTLVSSLYR